MPMPSLGSERADPIDAIKPTNALCICLGVDPAWSVDDQGLCATVPYRFGNELVLVSHALGFPGAGSSSLSLAQEAVKFANNVRETAGAPWLPVYVAFDATKDRTLGERLVEFGMASPVRGSGPRLPPLQGVLFGGVGTQQTPAQPIFVSLPGRGRFSVPVMHVPKAMLYASVRERLVLGLLKFAPGGQAQRLVHELEHLESTITAARRVSIQPAEGEHDDLADGLALSVWLAGEFEHVLFRSLERRSRPSRPAPSSLAWT